jgi:hypothetical protein
VLKKNVSSLSVLGADVMANVVSYLVSDHICKLYQCGSILLNFVLRHGGVRNFHHLISHRQWWPTIVSLFQINEFRIEMACGEFQTINQSDYIYIPEIALKQLPLTLKQLHIGPKLYCLHRMLFERFYSLQHLSVGHDSWLFDVHSGNTSPLPQTLSSLRFTGLRSILPTPNPLFTLDSNLTYLELSCRVDEPIVLPATLLYFVRNYPASASISSRLCKFEVKQWPSQLIHLEIRDERMKIFNASLVSQLPLSLTYLACYIESMFNSWDALPSNLRHFEPLGGSSLFGWEIPANRNLEVLPTSLTSIDLDHFINSTEDVMYPPHLISYSGLSLLHPNHIKGMPTSLTHLSVQTSLTSFLTLSHLLPNHHIKSLRYGSDYRSLGNQQHQQKNVVETDEKVVGRFSKNLHTLKIRLNVRTKTNYGRAGLFDDDDPLVFSLPTATTTTDDDTINAISDIFAYDFRNLVKLALHIPSMNCLPKNLPPLIKELSLYVPSLGPDGDLCMDSINSCNSIEKLFLSFDFYQDELDKNTSFTKNFHLFANLPSSITDLAICSNRAEIHHEQLRSLPMGLKYLTIAPSGVTSWNFETFTQLPHNLYLLNLSICKIVQFDISRLAKTCPKLGELYLHRNVSPFESINLEAAKLGIRSNQCEWFPPSWEH